HPRGHSPLGAPRLAPLGSPVFTGILAGTARSERRALWGSAPCSARRFSPQPEDVLHVVEAGIAVAQPLGGAHGAAGEGLARRGAVGQLQPLAEPAKIRRVLADDVAAAHRQDADLVAAADAHLAFAPVFRHFS